MDLLELTKDYFKKPKSERLNLVDDIIDEILVIVRENELQEELVLNHITNIIHNAEKREDYEIAEVFKIVLEKMKKIFLSNGLQL